MEIRQLIPKQYKKNRKSPYRDIWETSLRLKAQRLPFFDDTHWRTAYRDGSEGMFISVSMHQNKFSKNAMFCLRITRLEKSTISMKLRAGMKRCIGYFPCECSLPDERWEWAFSWDCMMIWLLMSDYLNILIIRLKKEHEQYLHNYYFYYVS